MLTIRLDVICYLIVKTREFEAKMEPEVPDPGDNPIDDADRQILFDHPDDPTFQEIRAALESLGDEERSEILALAWLGRGDYTAKEWKQALADARADPDDQRCEALLGMTLLPTFLEEGLSMLGYSCSDIEREHL